MPNSNRRTLMKVGGTVLGTSALSSVTVGGTQCDDSNTAADYESAVDAGLSYFQHRAKEQVTLAESLLSAIESGDLKNAKQAYVAARPPYEEIEVHAASFEPTDTAIDARPTSFTWGETSDQFKGFHRIERLLYRDDNLDEAESYAEELVSSTEQLQQDLTRRHRFDPSKHFEGMIGLANEVPTKKITSEEETFSDQSLLIFYHNWKGIYSQVRPFLSLLTERDAAVAQQLETAYTEALTTVEPHIQSDPVRATPYSQIANDRRGEIVHAGYHFRDILIEAAKTLDITTTWTK